MGNKFSAITTVVDGIKFPSRKEARRYQDLLLLQRAGEIRDLRRQVPIELIGQYGPLKTPSGKAMKLTVDFVYEDKGLNWAVVYEDSKGCETRDFIVRRAVAAAMGIEVKTT